MLELSVAAISNGFTNTLRFGSQARRTTSPACRRVEELVLQVAIRSSSSNFLSTLALATATASSDGSRG
jgi:hypothetical protein